MERNGAYGFPAGVPTYFSEPTSVEHNINLNGNNCLSMGNTDTTNTQYIAPVYQNILADLNYSYQNSNNLVFSPLTSSNIGFSPTHSNNNFNNTGFSGLHSNIAMNNIGFLPQHPSNWPAGGDSSGTTQGQYYFPANLPLYQAPPMQNFPANLPLYQAPLMQNFSLYQPSLIVQNFPLHQAPPPLFTHTSTEAPLSVSTHVTKVSKLKFLFQKQLQNSDVNNLKRIVIPKKAAEAFLPKLDKKGGTCVEMLDIDGSHIWNFVYRFWPNNKSRMYILENTGEFVKKNRLASGDLIFVYEDRETKGYVIEAKRTLDNILNDNPKRKTPRRNSSKASAQGQADTDTPMTDVPAVAAPTFEAGESLPTEVGNTDRATNEIQLLDSTSAGNGMQLLDYGLDTYNPSSSGNIDNVLNPPNQNDNKSPLIYNDEDFPSDYLFNMWEPGASSTQPSFQNLCFDDILKGL